MGSKSEILHFWNAYLTLETVKEDECPTHCVHQFTLSSKIQCTNLLLICKYTLVQLSLFDMPSLYQASLYLALYSMLCL